MIEQKQKITKADAVSYCIIAYNSITTRVQKKFLLFFYLKNKKEY